VSQGTRDTVPLQQGTIMQHKTLLIIDDEENMRHVLQSMLTKEGYDVTLAADGLEGLQQLSEQLFDYILCDIKMPRMDGLEFLKSLQNTRISSTIITMSAYGTIDLAIETMHLGAYDYISKPFKPAEIILTLKKAEERKRLKKENVLLREEVQRKYNFQNFVGKSAHIMHLFETIKKISLHKSPVLITGESGTGKELVAKAIHYNGPRCNQPFLAVNCGAIPENLLESELFGHKKGAFTGAVYDRRGIFEEADGGTILLDEIGELPHALQVKLLRVLQEGEMRRVGEDRSLMVDVRIIAATAKDLSQEAKKGNFREDLFYRLHVLPVHILPLRERREDIPLLITHFLQKYNRQNSLSIQSITSQAQKLLFNYPWPGNVRELENIIERTMVMTEKAVIDEHDLPYYIKHAAVEDINGSLAEEYSIKKMELVLEQKLIRKALTKTHGNKTRAAKLLEISYPALLSKIEEYGIEYEE
jgi:two-component system response regulator AtoC